MVLALASTSCAKLQARDNLNKGVRAFREGKYERSISYFQDAMKLDPELTNAELYLATAYSQQFVPNGNSPENAKNAEMAIQTFESVLKKEPNNVHAVEGLAYIYQNSNRLDKAREYYVKQTQIDQQNPTPFYAVGSVNWLLLQIKNALPPPEKQAELVDEGLQNLDKALTLNPDYEDAMAYKNLLYREKARLATDGEEKKKYEGMADEWFNKVLETRKKIQDKKKGPAGIIVGK
jgi:tetratricopeptide (TPR) repeat protein